MEVGALGAVGPEVSDVLALKQADAVGEAQASLLKKTLDLQKTLAAEVFQSLGLGTRIDLTA